MLESNLQNSEQSTANPIHLSIKSEKATFYTTVVFSSLIVALSTITGVVYIVLQWFGRQEILDALFVSMLIAATMVLLTAVRSFWRFITRKGLQTYQFLLSTVDPEAANYQYAAMCSSVFNTASMTISGLVYGAAIGSSPFLMPVWEDDELLRMMLSVFLFEINFVTGLAFYALIRFFVHSIEMGKLIRIQLWQLDNPGTNFLLSSTRRISVMASVYISICMTSIIFSVIPAKGLLVSYSMFSVIVILSCLVVPCFPIASRIREAKYEALAAVDEQLQKEFYVTLDRLRTSDQPVVLNRFDNLMLLRDKIDAVQSWPFRFKYVMSATSIIAVSSVPVVTQVILEKILK